MQNDTTKEIPLTQGKIALVSAQDYDRVSAYKWYARKKRRGQKISWYALCSSSRFPRRARRDMHGFILGAPKGAEIDHEDNNGLNNTRLNLRRCSHAQNMYNQALPENNTSGYKGVTYHKQVGKWQAGICHNRQFIYLGLFTDPVDAAKAYDDAAKERFGKFANLNFPRE